MFKNIFFLPTKISYEKIADKFLENLKLEQSPAVKHKFTIFFTEQPFYENHQKLDSHTRSFSFQNRHIKGL